MGACSCRADKKWQGNRGGFKASPLPLDAGCICNKLGSARNSLPACAACVLACVTALAQTRDSAAVKQRLGEVAKSYTAGNAFMGTVLVAEGDHILLDQGYGMANLEWNIPNAPDVKFRLGSLTKQFTATLILLLQQDGKLHIEDPVGKYLPDAPKKLGEDHAGQPAGPYLWDSQLHQRQGFWNLGDEQAHDRGGDRLFPRQAP